MRQDTFRVARRRVEPWDTRRAGGATVGQAMLTTDRGKHADDEKGEDSTTRQRGGEDANGGAYREQYDAGHCEGIT